MALEGFLQEFGLADILQLIYFQRKTGVLNIEGGTDRIKVSFINGNITVLESSRKLEDKKLGKILIKRGLITQEDLNNVLEIQKLEGVRLGSILVRRGLVSKEVIKEIIESQIIDTIAQIFAWKEGRYEFIPQELTIDKELPISLDTQHLLMEGVQIVDELSVVEGKLDLDNIYKKVRESDQVYLSNVEKEILSLMDGERDISTIINISTYGDFEASKAIISLEEKGIIEPIAVLSFGKEKITTTTTGLERGFYIAIFGIALIVLMFIFKGGFDTFKTFEEARIGMKMERLKTDIEIYNAANGGYPSNLEVVTKELDPWGRPYVYKLIEKGFTLFSSGPDGIEGTDDDVH
jgi:hypothetical protein